MYTILRRSDYFPEQGRERVDLLVAVRKSLSDNAPDQWIDIRLRSPSIELLEFTSWELLKTSNYWTAIIDRKPLIQTATCAQSVLTDIGPVLVANVGDIAAESLVTA